MSESKDLLAIRKDLLVAQSSLYRLKVVRDVASVRDGLEVVPAVLRHEPDVLLLDLSLPSTEVMPAPRAGDTARTHRRRHATTARLHICGADAPRRGAVEASKKYFTSVAGGVNDKRVEIKCMDGAVNS